MNDKAYSPGLEGVAAGESAISQIDTELNRLVIRGCDLVELTERTATYLDGLRVTAYLVNHGNPGGPFMAYRVEAEGRVIAYSGDTEWTDALIDAGRKADLFVAEAYFRDKKVPLHLDLATLEAHLPEIKPKRLILTHMSDDMLGQRADLPYDCAEDGMTVSL